MAIQVPGAKFKQLRKIKTNQKTYYEKTLPIFRFYTNTVTILLCKGYDRVR